MRKTGRYAWATAQPFVEAGLRQANRDTAGVFLLAAMGMRAGPDEEWVRWAQETYDFDPRTTAILKKRGK